jgi:hypothetical protein
VTGRLLGEADKVKPGGIFVVTLILKLVVAVRAPELPLTVTVSVPEAVLLAAKVSTQLPLPVMEVQPEFVTLTPLGMPVTLPIATVPLNPPLSVTVIVSLAVPPWAIDKFAGDAESVKLPVFDGPTVSVTVVVAGVNEPEAPVMVIDVVP